MHYKTCRKDLKAACGNFTTACGWVFWLKDAGLTKDVILWPFCSITWNSMDYVSYRKSPAEQQGPYVDLTKKFFVNVIEQKHQCLIS